MNAVIDEDMPRSLTFALKKSGWEVFDVRDVGLRGQDDEKIIAFAKKRKAVLFSGDWGFANIFKFPPEKYYGIVLCHFPNEVSPLFLANQVIKSLEKLSPKSYKYCLVIIEPGKLRIKKHTIVKKALK